MVASTCTIHLTYQNPMPNALSNRATRILDNRAPVTAEDIRIHAWINDRLAAIHRERNSLRTKVSRFLFGDRSN